MSNSWEEIDRIVCTLEPGTTIRGICSPTTPINQSSAMRSYMRDVAIYRFGLVRSILVSLGENKYLFLLVEINWDDVIDKQTEFLLVLIILSEVRAISNNDSLATAYFPPNPSRM